MKAARLASPGTLVLDELPSPRPREGEVVVELAACGVCGTDLEKLRGRYQTQGRIGHEPVGTVAALGEGVGGLAIGDRVFVHHHVPCLSCEVCRRGDLTFCPSYATTNLDPGGFAEQFRVPSENVARGAILRLDPSVGWEVGTLLEPAACALTALRRVGFREGDSVFILGLGPVGLLYARLARAWGAAWVGGAELSERRRRAARDGGADLVVDPTDPATVEAQVSSATAGRGVDLAVVATGAPPAVRLAPRLVRRGGTVNLFGLSERGSRLEADLQELYLSGIRIIPSYATTEADIAEVHQRLTGGRLDLSGLVTHRFPLDRIEEAFRTASTPETALKVVVTGPSFG
ncbi:MAG: alcohol dehydrogenase catalytic domain-containing protein [Thermoplasmata archaeon]|nr:alcohol dehydrogenase catalytic domain-containing protein [Thermoplasmata archaeon]MCI4359803.1 alcohol dehydrogenase catalytic domain-containing protein [Thermoplasmata archaeon]